MATGTEHALPPPAAMMGLISGYWVSQAIGVVAKLGVADQLSQGPRASDDVARIVGAEPQALYRVLRLLASLDVFAEVAPRTFGLTPLGETLRSVSRAPLGRGPLRRSGCGVGRVARLRSRAPRIRRRPTALA